ncbi:MAG: cyclic nucleotide-binding domain-containing protein [Roseiflexus sp.]|nr:cyclic nucleotide-binding domain-containing protein [Roseiflexus sp.]MCS7287688.1 cyclic nucleotide-binding domain-containing protein [Roseiflexus sp.]MDW8147885.1 cyclic nucleotide-binding domain-containing protein [Roseiflexaceae bacterium]MDW8233967.1 cyclic nucleotide-binding domain-containing protein [Roseiflexaceae bacterium]
MATLRATTTPDSGRTEASSRPIPGGIWAAVRRRAAALPAAHIRTYSLLQERIAHQSGSVSLWKILCDRTDPSRYRPHAIPDVAADPVREGDQTLYIVRSPRGNYLRLTEAQHEVWRAMDGTRTVSELGLAAFRQRGLILPIGELVAGLKSEGLLVDQPVGIYRAINEALTRGTTSAWGRRLRRILTGAVLSLPGIDGFYGALYRWGGRLLFTRIFALVAGVIAIVGVIAFGLAMRSGLDTYEVIRLNDSVTLGLAALWAVTLLSFVVHESAHALAVKHFGRTLTNGGVMLYYGLPAAFVDTSDIWRSPRRARIIVSAVGPAADLLVGSLAAVAAYLLPETAVGAIAYKLAFTSFVSSVFNLNPLLELDGYYILVDLLRMPDLRRSALAYVRGPLWEKLSAYLRMRYARWMQRTGKRRLAATPNLDGLPFSREERIFTIYGAATALYTLLATIGAVWFWRQQIFEPALELLGGAWWQRLIGAALILVVVLPAVAAVLLALWEAGHTIVGWLVRRGYGRRPGLLSTVGVLLTLIAALTVNATEYGDWRWMALAIGPALWIVALNVLLAVRPYYRGAAIYPAVLALVATTALAGLAGIARALLLPPGVWVTLDSLAFVGLLVAGFAVLLDVDLRTTPLRELLGAAMLIMGAFPVGVAALFIAQAAYPSAGAFAWLAMAAPAYFGALALALLLQHMFGLADSRLVWAWALLWAGALVKTAGYITDLRGSGLTLDVLGSGLWATAWLVHLTTLRHLTLREFRWEHIPSMNESDRLARAFQLTYRGCYQLLHSVYGERRARALDDRMDILAATANWEITLDHEEARIGQQIKMLPIAEQGARFAEVLRYTVAEIEQIAGAAFARRCIQAAYDALPWPERETASRLCFPDTPWARELSRSFGDIHAARLRLLRQVDIFLSCDDDELEALVASAVEQTFPTGATVLRAGAPAPGIWIIEAGEIVARRGGRIVAELHRGDTIGAEEVLGDAPSTHTYRATVTSSLLYLPADELFRLAAGRVPHAAAGLESVEVLRLLERVPLFADLPRNTLRGLAAIAEQRTYPARAVVVRQGTPSGMFFVIRKGTAAVIRRDLATNGPKPQMRLIARLGPQEFFGELELLRNAPPVASVIAMTPLTVLALPHAAIQALVHSDGGVSQRLERVGTGRLKALESA